MIQIKQCVCGEYPQIRLYRSYSHAFECWEAICKGCGRRVRKYPKTEENAIAAWNALVLEDEARRDSEDELIYDLEHSDYGYSGNGAKLRDRALARLLKSLKG